MSPNLLGNVFFYFIISLTAATIGCRAELQSSTSGRANSNVSDEDKPPQNESSPDGADLPPVVKDSDSTTNSTTKTTPSGADPVEKVTAPAVPGNFVATASSPSQIDLSWSNVTGETGYEVDWSLDGTSNWQSVGLISADTTSVAHSSLSASTTYYYRIRALNSAGASAYTNASATTSPSDGSRFRNPNLLRDINVGASANDHGYTKNFVTLANNKVLFVAMNYQSGEEVWVTDGTGAGTFSLDNLNSSSASFPGNIRTNQQRTAALFLCNSESAGQGLCISDATLAGTRRIKGDFFGSIGNTSLCGQRVFATGTFGANGASLVSSDGTGPLELAKTYADMGATAISQPTCVGSRLYFTTTDSVYGNELWTSDGTSSGTYLVHDVYSGPNAGLQNILGAIGEKLLFGGKTAAYTGSELWMYDPNAADCTAFDAGTSTCVDSSGGAGKIGIVKDIFAGTTDSGVTSSSAVIMNGKLYFQGIDASSNSELWYTDGTTAGTLKVYDFAGNAGAPDLSKATVYEAGASSRLYFPIYRGGDGYGNEPHMLALDPGVMNCSATYGTDFRTPLNGGGCIGMIADMVPGSTGYKAVFLGANADGAYFKANPAGTVGYYHWNNTTSAPVEFTSTIAVDSGYTVAASGLFFSTHSNPPTGVGGRRELWFTDGSTPTVVKEINSEAGSIGTSNNSRVTDITIGTRRYFVAFDEDSGSELWVTDGTSSGTQMVKDINPGTGSAGISDIVVMGGVLYFQASDGTSGVELWAYDSSAADCTRFDPSTSYATGCATADSAKVPGRIGVVKDINVGSGHSNVSKLSVVDGRLYFFASTTTEGIEPYVSDGTTTGTVLLQNFGTGTADSTGSTFARAGNSVVFQATNGSGQNDLFSFIPGAEADDAACVATHGVGFAKANAAGCYKLLYDFTDQAPGIVILGSTANGTKAFFNAAEAATGKELWVTDGTTAGTSNVSDIFPGSGSSTSLFNSGSAGAFGADKFVFPAIDSYSANGEASQQIWITDGTPAGTTKISNLDSGYYARGLLVDNDVQKIFFIGGTSATGMELWKSDGDLASTSMVVDLCPGTCNGAIAANELNIKFGVSSIGEGRVMFRGQNGSSGSEPVVSDGTALGTYLIEIAAGSAGSSPLFFMPISDGAQVSKVVIYATDGSSGYEPWVVTIDLRIIKATI
jgi:ELWxxDGT repeat protein